MFTPKAHNIIEYNIMHEMVVSENHSSSSTTVEDLECMHCWAISSQIRTVRYYSILTNDS
jgi:hypothetical protein